MDRKRVEYELVKLKEVFPDAKITEDRKFVLIPSVFLPARYNLESTPLLIRLADSVPTVYVSNLLTLNWVRPTAFRNPKENSLQSQWYELCWRNPPAVENLRSFVASALVYLRQL